MFTNIESELVFLGGLYKYPIEFVNYHKLITVHQDFSDENNQWLYEKFSAYYTQFLSRSTNMAITSTQFALFLSQDKSNTEVYNKLGGWRYIERIMALPDEDKMKVYFNTIKKYSLIRQLKEKSFPVDWLLKHKKFEQLTAGDILHIYNYNLSQIMATVTNEESAIDLTSNLENLIEGYCNSPYLGIPFRWQKYTDYFLGAKYGDLMLSFGYVNSGKSRKAVSMMADLVFNKGEKVIMLENEMNKAKTQNCLITTVCNDPVYNFNLNIKERDIKLGQYKTDNEKKKVLEVARFVESYSNKWYFKEMNKFSDTDLELEVRKAVLGLGCTTLMYGTLKSYGGKSGDWAALKQTTTHLKNLTNELGIFTHATAQLDMTSGKLNVFDLDESNIGESKGIVQMADIAVIDKEIGRDIFSKCYMDKDEFTSESLNPKIKYNGSKILKNRDGSKATFIQEYNLDTNIWSDYNYLSMEIIK